MKILIIPDVHERYWRMMDILAFYESEVDSVVFLGDYFDSFDEPFGNFMQMCSFLKENASNPKYTFLLGNHDVQYFARENYFCSGYNPQKHEYIKKHLGFYFFLDNFSFIHREGKYVFSHAGVHESFFMPFISAEDQFVKMNADIKECLVRGIPCPLLDAGRGRGGRNSVGGVTWLDWNEEYEPLSVDFNQIVGHTRQRNTNYGTALKTRQDYDFVDRCDFCVDNDLSVGVILNTKNHTISFYDDNGDEIETRSTRWL